MGATPSYNFTCDICGETAQTEIDTYLRNSTAKVPTGWWVFTTWQVVGMGSGEDAYSDFTEADEWIESFCAGCTERLSAFLVQLKDNPRVVSTGKQEAESNGRLDVLLAKQQGSSLTDTPVKTPESHVEPRTAHPATPGDPEAFQDLSDPHKTIHGMHHYTLARNCVYRTDSAFQEGYLCQTCAQGSRVQRSGGCA